MLHSYTHIKLGRREYNLDIWKKSFPNFKDRASGRRKAPLTELESVRPFFFALLLFSRRETRQLGEGGETMSVAILVLCMYVLAWYGTPPCVV
jgi:hypothetical protein